MFLSRDDWELGVAFQTHPGVRRRLEGKQRPSLSSRVATGISWSPLSGLKGVKPPLEFGERTRDCTPGHAGKEGPHLTKTGGSRWFYRAAAPVLVSQEVRRGSQPSPWVGPGKPNLPLGLRGKAGGCARVTAGPKRPHLGVCPGPHIPLQGRQGSRGCIPGSPGESGLVSRGSQGLRSPLESRRGSLGAP